MLRPGGVFLAELYTPAQVHGQYKTGGPPVAEMCACPIGQVSTPTHPPSNAGSPTLDPLPLSLGIDPRELRDALAAVGSFEVLEETEYEIHEGSLHTGLGAVVRVLWRKSDA